MKALFFTYYCLLVLCMMGGSVSGFVNRTITSDECRKCINDNRKFCPNTQYTEGYCCDEGDACPQTVKCSDYYTIP